MLLSLVAALLVTAASADTTASFGGFTFNWTTSSQSLAIKSKLSSAPIWSTIPNTAFISTSFGYDNFSEASGNWNITTNDSGICTGQSVSAVSASKNLFSISGALTGSTNCSSVNYKLQFSVATNLTDRLAFNLTLSSTSAAVKVPRSILTFSTGGDEDFYGFGEQASFSTMRGQVVPIFSREGGVGRGDEPLTELLNDNSSISGAFAGGSQFTSYTSIPQYVSTENKLFYITGSAYTQFDFTQVGAASVRYDEPSMQGHFTIASSMLDAVAKYTDYTGKQPHLPEWVDSGAIMGIQGGQDKVEGIVKNASIYDCPRAGVWLQDWCGTHSQPSTYVNISRLWWNWESDSKLYPNWTEWVGHLKSTYGVRTLNYVNTFLADPTSKPDGFKTDLYAIATENGYFIKNLTNQTNIISSGPGITAGVLDLANPVTFAWFKGIVKTHIWSTGVSGFMSDFGEYQTISDTIMNNSHTDPFLYHNLYPAEWARLQREVVIELGLEDEAVVFHRSAGILSPGHMNVFWVGDQDLSWGVNDGIKSVVTSALSVGFSGIGASHSDIGGYTDVLSTLGNMTRSPELLGRWGELGAVSGAIFRSHEGNIPSVNAQFYSNASTFGYYAYNARMFASLAPYRRRILDEDVVGKGWPLVRHPVVYHPSDAELRNITYEAFYLGAGAYVAPVLDPGVDTVSVYLPANVKGWLHVWSNKKYNGGQTVTVGAPLGKPGVFIKLPRQPNDGLDKFMQFIQAENNTALTIT